MAGSTPADSSAPATGARGFFGQPVGISTLFFTELWERFSYYGMRAILLLFLVAQVQTGGMGLDDKTAAAIYGLYTAGVYIMSMPGGWIADRVLGTQRAVFSGGTLIMLGHTVLALSRTQPTFLLGLTLIVLGTGLLKPNISAMVGAVQRGSEAQRDAAFSLFYMAINIGGTVGNILVPLLAQQFGWHVGFGSAAFFMAIGLVWFLATRHKLGEIGLKPTLIHRDNARRNTLILCGMIAAIIALILLLWTGVLHMDPVVLQGRATQAMVLAVVVYFLCLLLFAGLNGSERRGVFVLMILVAASTLFWAGYEQAGSSLTLFADHVTDKHIGTYEFPAGWFQALQSIFVLLFAPLMAVFWTRLDRRGGRMSVMTKFAVGLLGMGLGFLVMVGGAHTVSGGQNAGPHWLVLAYLLHVVGEMFLSPVGMSATTRLVPRRFAGQGMGLWFTSIAMGNLFASVLAGKLSKDMTGPQWSAYFFRMFTWAAAAALLLLALLPLLRRWAALDNTRDDGAGAQRNSSS